MFYRKHKTETVIESRSVDFLDNSDFARITEEEYIALLAELLGFDSKDADITTQEVTE